MNEQGPPRDWSEVVDHEITKNRERREAGFAEVSDAGGSNSEHIAAAQCVHLGYISDTLVDILRTLAHISDQLPPLR